MLMPYLITQYCLGLGLNKPSAAATAAHSRFNARGNAFSPSTPLSVNLVLKNYSLANNHVCNFAKPFCFSK